MEENRALTQDELVSKITDCLNGRTGNHMIFFPSFEYMNQIMPKIEQDLKSCGVSKYKIISQISEMTNADKAAFLESTKCAMFREHGDPLSAL